jgi:hypothetical protein
MCVWCVWWPWMALFTIKPRDVHQSQALKKSNQEFWSGLTSNLRLCGKSAGFAACLSHTATVRKYSKSKYFYKSMVCKNAGKMKELEERKERSIVSLLPSSGSHNNCVCQGHTGLPGQGPLPLSQSSTEALWIVEDLWARDVAQR